jgi:hypothetical protein
MKNKSKAQKIKADRAKALKRWEYQTIEQLSWGRSVVYGSHVKNNHPGSPVKSGRFLGGFVI